MTLVKVVSSGSTYAVYSIGEKTDLEPWKKVSLVSRQVAQATSSLVLLCLRGAREVELVGGGLQQAGGGGVEEGSTLGVRPKGESVASRSRFAGFLPFLGSLGLAPPSHIPNSQGQLVAGFRRPPRLRLPSAPH